MTDAWLRVLPLPGAGKRIEIRDTRESGLVLRMLPSGGGAWSVRARTKDGKQTRPTIGTWPTMGISDARKKARATIVALQCGADPVAEKRSARAERRAKAQAPTVAQRLSNWQAAREADPVRPWSARHAAEVRRVCSREIEPVLGPRALADTTRAEWTQIVSAKRKKAPAMAAAIYRIASSFLGYAEAHGWVATALLPRKGLAMLAPPAPARERTLSDEELLSVWHASASLGPKPRTFIRLLLLTAARQKEVADLSAGELDLAAGRWSLPPARAKNRNGLVLPLCGLAIAELRSVWPTNAPAPVLTLLGARRGKGFSGFSKVKAALDAAIRDARDTDVPPWRLHDLRRTARTGMARLGVPNDHAEAAINHVSGRTALERTYDRHDYSAEVIAALDTWQSHVARLVQSSSMPEP